DVAADVRLASADVHDTGITRRDGDRTDRPDRLVVEDRLPVRAAVGALPDAATRRAGVIRVGIARHASDGVGAVPLRADEPPLERGQECAVWRRAPHRGDDRLILWRVLAARLLLGAGEGGGEDDGGKERRDGRQAERGAAGGRHGADLGGWRMAEGGAAGANICATTGARRKGEGGTRTVGRVHP